MNERKMRAVRKYGKALEDLRRIAQKQGWALLPLTDSDGSSLGIFAVGKLDSVAILQELLKEVKDDTQSGK